MYNLNLTFVSNTGKEIVAQVEKEAPKRSRRVGSKDSQDKTGVKGF